MLKLFRSSLLLYIALLLAGIALSVFFGGEIIILDNKVSPPFGLESWNPVMTVYYISTMIFICAFVATIYASKKNNNIVSLLNKECNPQLFINKYNKILKRNKGALRQYVLLQLSAGNLNLGDLQMARQMLDTAASCGFSNTKQSASNQFHYYQLMCSLFLSANDIENAEKTLSYLKVSAQNPKMYPVNKNSTLSLCTSLQFSINIEKGIYDGAEQFFNNAFDIASIPIEKVSNKFFLGKIYMYFNRTEEAKTAFEYVIANGNKIICVKKAQQFLNQINGEQI